MMRCGIEMADIGTNEAATAESRHQPTLRIVQSLCRKIESAVGATERLRGTTVALEWARLLQQQQNDGKLGLTPSFLVAALRRVPGAILGPVLGLQELRVLLEMMRDEREPHGKVVSIFECPSLLQPVATLSTSDAPGDPIEGRPGAPVKLYVWPWLPSKRPVDFDWLVQTLWAHFDDPISTGNFSYSRTTRRFRPFDKYDEDFIERALCASDNA